jgi:succinate dehydrogenase/fumarate reductase cytochrome b subunit
MLSLHSNQSSCVRGAKTMNDHTQCPACRSLSTHVTNREFKASGFQAFGNRVCDQCGTAWRPRCPRWAAIVSIVTGCAMLGGFLAVAWPDLQRYGLASFFESARASGKTIKPLKGFAILVVVALWACFYGVAVLLGRAGKMEILGKVLAAPPAPKISEPDSSSSTDGVCAGCRRPVPSGSVYCPHCGLRERS